MKCCLRFTNEKKRETNEDVVSLSKLNVMYDKKLKMGQIKKAGTKKVLPSILPLPGPSSALHLPLTRTGCCKDKAKFGFVQTFFPKI